MKYWLILLLIPLVFAGEIHHADLVNNDFAFVTLAERDIVDFEYNNSIHRLMIRELLPEEKSVELTFFMAGVENPLYVTISDKLKLQVDFEKDGKVDMNVWYANIDKEGNVTLKIEKVKHKEEPILIKEGKSFLNYFNIEKLKKYYSDRVGLGLIISILAIIILFSNRRWIRRKFRRVKRRFKGY